MSPFLLINFVRSNVDKINNVVLVKRKHYSIFLIDGKRPVFFIFSV